MFASNAAFCVYYACGVSFKMQDKQIMKMIEPLNHSCIMHHAWCVAGYRAVPRDAIMHIEALQPSQKRSLVYSFTQCQWRSSSVQEMDRSPNGSKFWNSGLVRLSFALMILRVLYNRRTLTR